jgi:hypothetical protein
MTNGLASMFRFTIREIVLLTLITALACGWYLERRRARQLESKNRELAKLTDASAAEIRRLHRVNEITSEQWAKTLGQIRSGKSESVSLGDP